MPYYVDLEFKNKKRLIRFLNLIVATNTKNYCTCNITVASHGPASREKYLCYKSEVANGVRSLVHMDGPAERS